jgi:hypothetical protein
MVSKLKNCVNNAQLCCGCVVTAKSMPIVCNHSGANDVHSSIDSSGAQRHLQESAELVEFRHTAHWMGKPTLIREHAVASD